MKQLQNTNTTQQALPTCQESSSTRSQPRGTLLLGDSGLITVRASNLNDQCSVRTVKDANIDLISCWVTEKLQWIPKYCILYCGLQDILDRSSPTDIFDKLGSLVASLKQVNDNMDIHICELAPVMRVEEFDDNINNFNNQLSTWSMDNGVSIIKTNLQFRLGTGEVDHMCFHDNNENQGDFLNRYGVIGLLNIIHKKCPSFKLHDNWDSIMNQMTSTTAGLQNFVRNKRNPINLDYEERNDRDFGNHYISRNETEHSRRNMRQYEADGRQNNQYPTGHRRSSSNEGWRQNFRADPINRQRRTSFSHRHRHRPMQRKELNNRSRHRPCYNCGEINHDFSECRHQHRIRCNSCHEYGHKTRLCQYEQ